MLFNFNYRGQFMKLLTATKLLLSGSLFMGASVVYAADDIKSLEGMFSGVIVNEKSDPDLGHVMEVEGDFKGLTGISGKGVIKFVLAGHHNHKAPTTADATHDHEEEEHQAVECNDAAGEGELIFGTSKINFSNVGTVCIHVPGAENPKLHLFNGVYHFNNGTNKYKGIFGAGNISGSLSADMSVKDSTNKRVLLRFNGVMKK
jgi:hypothetical protein